MIDPNEYSAPDTTHGTLTPLATSRRPGPRSAGKEVADPVSTPHETDGLALYRRRAEILLIDDDDVDRERIQRLVRKAELPYRVTGAASGVEALQHLNEQSFDLILLDYHLADMTGFDLLRRLQKWVGFNTPVIMITGGGDENLAVEALHRGIADYIPKRSLNNETLRLAVTNALRMADAEARLRATQERLIRLSMFDELTGLPNRCLFFDRLEQAIARSQRRRESFSLLMIDLNLFKEVNDYFGHAAGDRVLSVIGDRLSHASRKSDTISRLGGDEFACLLPDTHTNGEIDACVMKLHESICQAVNLGDRVVQVGASIGIARFPEDGLESHILLANADAAMYAAKKSHRKYAFFGDDATRVKGAMPGCQSLREGIEQQELYLEFQPQISLATSEIVGIEALVRWHSPKFGLVRPNDFIPSAETSGLIREVTRSVLEMGLDQIGRWHGLGLHYPVSFNISARLLDDDGWVEWLLGELDKRGIGANEVILEITETALASSNRTQRERLHELSRRGIGLSIDDFGAGFTSFKSIREWLPSEVKIDRLFITNVTEGSSDASIIRSIVMLATSLGIRAIAEGIETTAEQDFLRLAGCECGQGFGIARPMSSHEATQWLLHRTPPEPLH
jgi:diguanylate cyclase (GGDEF)-like protein